MLVMKKNKIVLFLASVSSLLFLTYVLRLTLEIPKIEENLLASPNVIDITGKIQTLVMVSDKNIKERGWTLSGFSDTGWKEIVIPRFKVMQVPGFTEGAVAYYRIKIPKSALKELSHLQQEVAVSLQYIFFHEMEIYVNGNLYQRSTPREAVEHIVTVPVDETKDNIIAVKGFIKKGDSGINHRGHIIAGKIGELHELYSKSYKATTVFPLILILCKGSILLVFSLILLMVRVEKYFEKAILFAIFVLLEDILTGNYLMKFLTLDFMIYLYNVANIGMVLCLIMVFSDVLRLSYSRKKLLILSGSLVAVSYALAIHVIFQSSLFNVDHFLKFWNLIMMSTLLYFVPLSFRKEKVLFSVLVSATMMIFWSTFFSANVGYNLKYFANLLIFFTVAFQTFLLFRREQNQLREQEKEVAIGRTASLLAHDVRKPLEQMSLLLDRLSTDRPDPNFLAVARRDVRLALSNVNNQIGDIMNFSRKQALILEPISLYDVLASCLKQVMAVKKNVNLVLEYDFKAPQKILGDESRLSSAMVNIISNAVEAIQEIGNRTEGRIRFSTRIKKSQLLFSIWNDGPLIPQELIKEIFQPLSTHGKKSGTGLGLASVSKIIQDHGGEVLAENCPDGVVFHLSFKLAELQDRAEQYEFLPRSAQYRYDEVQSPPRATKKTFRIFLLDDDSFVYEYFRNLMAGLEFSVELDYAQSFDKGEELLKSQRYDLHILDYDLGENGTGENFQHLFLNHVSQGVILHTNRDSSSLQRLNIPVIKKPMTLTDLRSHVQKADAERLKLLLVDDSELTVMAWQLFHGPDNVIAFSTPDDALKFVERSSGEFNLCVLDYYYDGSSWNGVKLGEAIQKLVPGARIFISTNADLTDVPFKVIRKNEFDVRYQL